MSYDVGRLLRPADVLLVVPPFAWQDRPALGVHLLQALARQAGFEAQVLYTNFLFSAFFDEGTHDTVAQMQYGLYLGERLFARAALGGPPLGRDRGRGIVPILDALDESYRRMGASHTFTLSAILRIEAQIEEWLASFVPALAARRYRIVGCTSSFEQNLSSLAILARLGETSSKLIMGGANCEDEMAEGIAALADRAAIRIDHIFAGESDHAFVELLRREPRERIIRGEPCRDLDALPTPDYTDYVEQLHAVVPRVARKGVHLTYETSRGCWWGAKSHCTFCGLNGQGMAPREKSPDRVLADLQQLATKHGIRRFTMTDNIMPHQYFRTLVPRLPRELPGARIMYEQKANLRLDQVRDLVVAGIVEIQPGIEALSSELLKRMAKGTTCAQNLALLRYARATGLLVQWNLLHGFPGDDAAAYRETLELIPLIPHLQPPVSPCPVVIDRFSPYFTHPERYGITDVRPFGFYAGVYDDDVPLAKLAYHFEATFDCATRREPALVKQLADAVTAWRRQYFAPTPAELRVERDNSGYLLVDTRGRGHPHEQRIDEEQASIALVARPSRERSRCAWALAHELVVERDRKLVPLAVADPDLLLELEQQRPALAVAV